MTANIDDNSHIEKWLAKSMDKENVSTASESTDEILPEDDNVSILQAHRSHNDPPIADVPKLEDLHTTHQDRVCLVPNISINKNLTLMDSKHAGGLVPVLVGPLPKVRLSSNLLDQDQTEKPLTTTQRELLAKTQSSGPTALYDQSGEFSKDPIKAKTDLANPDRQALPTWEGTLVATVARDLHSEHVPAQDSRTATHIEGQQCQSDGVPDESNTISDAPLTQDTTHTLAISSDNSSTTTMSPLLAQFKRVVSTSSTVVAPTKVDVYKSSESDLTENENALREANDVLVSKIAGTKLVTKDDAKHASAGNVNENIADRENAQFFGNWGEPAARAKPKSRVRKVVLSRLPVGSDLTLAQSLIHGGAIDEMSIHQSGTVAHVTFTNADACDTYQTKYPNGIVIKHKGRDHIVFVDKGQDVNVVSGMLEAYLDAGASRVVRAVNADADWTMRALHRVAEGPKSNRKVESIADTFRNEVRTVIFRFANVHDAVAFRGLLRRDPEWEFADISFMVDPCELATGIHSD